MLFIFDGWCTFCQVYQHSQYTRCETSAKRLFKELEARAIVYIYLYKEMLAGLPFKS